MGRNGLEYLTAFDAEKYGDGLAQTIEYMPPKVIRHEEEKPTYDTLKPLGATEKKEEVVIPTTEMLEKTSEEPALDAETEALFAKLELGTDETLREIAKSLDIKGFNNMKRENLITRIKNATLAKKSLA